MSPKAMFGFLEILLFLEPFTILLLHCPTELRHIAAENNMSCLDSFAKLRKATSSFVTSVCLSICASKWNNSDPTVRISVKSDMDYF